MTSVIEMARQSTKMHLCGESFSNIVKICVEKLEKDNYHVLKIYREYSLYKIHEDFVSKISCEVKSYYKSHLRIPRTIFQMMSLPEIKIRVDQMISNMELSISVWIVYTIIAMTSTFGYVTRKYMYCKRHIYLNLYGTPTIVKPMELKFTYRILDDSPKYIHHPMKLNISSIYGEIKG